MTAPSQLAGGAGGRPAVAWGADSCWPPGVPTPHTGRHDLNFQCAARTSPGPFPAGLCSTGLAIPHPGRQPTLSPRRRISRRAPCRCVSTRGLSIDKSRGLAPRDVDAVVVEHEVAGNALIVTLPAHAQNAPPAPRPSTSIMGGAPTAAKRDVTQQFFNDPKKPPAMASGTRGGGR